MKRIAMMSAVLIAGLTAGCGGEQGGTSTLAILLTDAPGDFEQVPITIDDIEAAFQGEQVRTRSAYRQADPAGSMIEIQQRTEAEQGEAAQAEGEGEWMQLMQQQQTQDLIQLQDGKTAMLGEMEVPAGFYHQLRVRLAKAQAMQNGQMQELDVPAEAQEGLELSFMFQLKAQQRYELVLDFDAAQSIMQEGEQLKLQPAISVKHFRYQQMQQNSQGQQ